VIGFFILNLLGDDRHRGVKLLRHPLARHLAAGRLDDALVQRLERIPALSSVLFVTFQIVFRGLHLRDSRRDRGLCAGAARFSGQALVMLLFLLPLLVPPITFGIPLATVLYQIGSRRRFWGVVLANLVPTRALRDPGDDPVHRADRPKIEAAARVFGANTFKLFLRPPAAC
jgi:hypothetical protein